MFDLILTVFSALHFLKLHFVYNHLLAQSYDIKYSYLMVIIYEQLYGLFYSYQIPISFFIYFTHKFIDVTPQVLPL